MTPTPRSPGCMAGPRRPHGVTAAWAEAADAELTAGNAARDRSDYAAAIGHYRPRLASDPQSYEAKFQLARAPVHTPAAARRRYDSTAELLSTRPTNSDLLLARGRSYAWEGRWSESEADLAAVTRLLPEYGDAWAASAICICGAAAPRMRSRPTPVGYLSAERARRVSRPIQGLSVIGGPNSGASRSEKGRARSGATTRRLTGLIATREARRRRSATKSAAGHETLQRASRGRSYPERCVLTPAMRGVFAGVADVCSQFEALPALADRSRSVG